MDQQVEGCRLVWYARSKELMFLKTVSRSSVSQTPCSARNPTEAIKSCGEKCANLCRVYKLIMISHVPGYGQLEYLEVNYWLISSLYLINVLGIIITIVNW